jgi:hypothetical protein
MNKVQTKEREAIEQLANWSLNFEDHNNPFNLFLDLIGYSDSQYGELITEGTSFMGYKEYVLLADALKLFENNGYETIYKMIVEFIETN